MDLHKKIRIKSGYPDLAWKNKPKIRFAKVDLICKHYANTMQTTDDANTTRMQISNLRTSLDCLYSMDLDTPTVDTPTHLWIEVWNVCVTLWCYYKHKMVIFVDISICCATCKMRSKVRGVVPQFIHTNTSNECSSTHCVAQESYHMQRITVVANDSEMSIIVELSLIHIWRCRRRG